MLGYTICLFSVNSYFSQSEYCNVVKPTTVEQSPAFDDYFKATSIYKLSKVKSFVICEFNVNIIEEGHIDIRSGRVKGNMDNAMLNLQFKLDNLDKKICLGIINLELMCRIYPKLHESIIENRL